MLLRSPHGGVDNISEQKAAGMEWIACNVRDFAAQTWDTVRMKAAALGVPVFPWGRVGHPESETRRDAEDFLGNLVFIGHQWGSEWILPNLEKEAESIAPPGFCAEVLRGLGFPGHVGWSTQAWLPNSVDFSPIAHDPVLLQIFPEDNRWTPEEIPQKMTDCLRHARDKGFVYAGVTYQTYRAEPSWYDLTGVHSFFTGDDIGPGNWDKWSG